MVEAREAFPEGQGRVNHSRITTSRPKLPGGTVVLRFRYTAIEVSVGTEPRTQSLL